MRPPTCPPWSACPVRPGRRQCRRDLVICHNVLEYVDSPPAALAAVARVLRPGGTVSVLAANTVAAVLQRALAGKYAEARAMLPGVDRDSAPHRGRRPGRRLPRDGAAGAPLHVARAHRADRGGRAAGGGRARDQGLLRPAARGAADLAAVEALRALEEAAATCPPLRDIATRLHVLGSAYRA